jgi:hypothetical protein
MSDNLIPATAMPPQTVPPLQPGSTSVGNSAYKTSQLQTQQQMALLGKTVGGFRCKRKARGGAAPQIVVPPPPVNAPNPSMTSSNYKDLTQLAATQQQQASYDTAKTPTDTLKIENANNSLYSGTGGSKKGGYYPKWGCLSGGKKRSKTRKTKSLKKNKKCKTKRRNYRK